MDAAPPPEFRRILRPAGHRVRGHKGEPARQRAARDAAPKARKAITRAKRIARQAQGRYLAAIRTLSKDAKAKIQQIRKESGVDAAIKAALKATSL